MKLNTGFWERQTKYPTLLPRFTKKKKKEDSKKIINEREEIKLIPQKYKGS